MLLRLQPHGAGAARAARPLAAAERRARPHGPRTPRAPHGPGPAAALPQGRPGLRSRRRVRRSGGRGGAAGPRTEVRLQLSPSLPSPGLGRGHREPRRTLTSTLRHPKPKDWPQSGSKTGRARDPAVPAQHSLARRADFRARVAALGANLPAMPDCMGRMEPGGSTA